MLRVAHASTVQEELGADGFSGERLFRNHRWTAQRFVSRCVVMLNQEQHVPLESSKMLSRILPL